MSYISKQTKLFYRYLEITGTLPCKIAGYIAIHIDPINKSYYLHKKFLAHKFNCSVRTINNALKLFKKDKYYTVTRHHVYINYHNEKTNRAIRILKGGDKNAND